jgi:hypothetical protein
MTMKTYITPALAAKGSVVALTQGVFDAVNDPDERTSHMPVGSVGFGL